MSDRDNQPRSVYIWVCEGTWRASVDAALSLAPAGSRFTLLHVTSADVPDAARGAYAGLFGRGHRAGDDPGTRLEKMAATAASDLLEAAAGRLGRDVRTAGNSGPTRTGRGGSLGGGGFAGRGAGRRPDPARAEEPGQDHPVCRGPCGLPGPAGLARICARRGHHPPAAAPPSATATSPFPAGPLNRETRTRRATTCSISITNSSEGGLADVAEMTGETRVVALDRLWPGDIADRTGDLLDIVPTN